MSTEKGHLRIIILIFIILISKFYPSLAILCRSNLNINKLTCMLVCQYNKCTWYVSSSVETHHLCFHISIGSLKREKRKKLSTNEELNCRHQTRNLINNLEFCTRITQHHLLAPSSCTHLSNTQIPGWSIAG